MIQRCSRETKQKKQTNKKKKHVQGRREAHKNKRITSVTTETLAKRKGHRFLPFHDSDFPVLN